MKTSVKIHLESTETKRFEIENKYAEYVSKLETICKIPQGKKVEYLDCDGDWIGLSSEEEFNEALKYKKDENVLVIRESKCNKNKSHASGKEKKERKGRKCIVYSGSPFERRNRRKKRRFKKGGMKDLKKRENHHHFMKRKKEESNSGRIERKIQVIKNSKIPDEVKEKLIFKMKEKQKKSF